MTLGGRVDVRIRGGMSARTEVEIVITGFVDCICCQFNVFKLLEREREREGGKERENKNKR